MTKILVLYYSRTGLTRTIARQIANACGADLESIEDAGERSPARGYMRSAVEAALHVATPIRPARRVPSDYDVVVIGTPIWFRNVPGPVRSYLRRQRRQFRRVAFFCSHRGAGPAKVLRDLESLCGRPAVATLAVAGTEIAGQPYRDRLSEFTDALKDLDGSYWQPGRGVRTFDTSAVSL